jgi:glycosyltransferase involved in cell wall biosynthesis
MAAVATTTLPRADAPAGNLPEARGWLASRSNGPAARGAAFFHAPSQVFQAPGGGENQLIQTGRYLEALGVPVRPFNPWTDRLEPERARLLHLFGLSREGLELARAARARGVPVVVSPICWYEPRALVALAGGPARAARDLAKWAAQRLAPRWPRWRRELLMIADAVLPNSRAEASQLVRLFALDPQKVRVVVNGVEPRFASASPGPWRDRFGAGKCVLYAGRVEPRKNVLGLVVAARAAGLPLTVIGDAPPGHSGYLNACRRAGGDLVRWLTALGHDDPLLASAYASARVVALPSWFETPGLAALEGALAGAAVVVTPYGCAREYFGGLVGYARPDRPAEVARALELAWRAGPDPRLAPHVAARFLWSEVARQTAGVYDQVAG